MEGAMIGNAIHQRRRVRREQDMQLAQQQILAAQQAAIRDANANAERARAKAAALRCQQPVASAAGAVTVSVVVPAGVKSDSKAGKAEQAQVNVLNVHNRLLSPFPRPRVLGPSVCPSRARSRHSLSCAAVRSIKRSRAAP
jgi:hypothetical protein